MKSRKGIKIVDSSPGITKGSRADKYWQKSGLTPYFTKVRPGMKLPAKYQTNDPAGIISNFNLSGLGFGNWVTLEDRYNYMSSLVLALYDLNAVLRFNNNLGMGRLGITFGARGSGGALAHYEPGSDIINITRYKDGLSSKAVRFFSTGGLGSFAHEYGHFLDYFAGSTLAPSPQIYSLTNGDSIAKTGPETTNPMRQKCNELMDAIIWKIPGKVESAYYKKLMVAIDNTPMGEYYISRNELFARAFEQWVAYEMRKNRIKNHLLTKMKYTGVVYLSPSEMKKVAPIFSQLISMIRKAIR